MHAIKKPLGYVYMTTNTLNGKYYIGSHAGSNPNYMGSGTALKLAFAKYGIEYFTKEVLYYCDDFKEHEEALLIAIDAAGDPNMYNLINSGKGGCLGLKHSSETLAKMRAGQIGKTPTAETRAKMRAAQLGKTATAETRAKLRVARLGRTNTAETRAKISAAQSGHLNHRYGRTATAETRAKLRVSRIGKTATAETRAKIRAAQLGRPHPKVGCPHCSKIGGYRSMSRYHFDNCKQAPK